MTRYINATHDITEKDLVMYNWHLLKCKAALNKIKQPKKKWWTRLFITNN